jgi:hypothetical protein
LEVGAHQVCCPLLQALFMTARALPTTSTVTVRIINTEVFIATSQPRAPKPTDPRFSVVENEPTMNAQDGIKRLIDASLGRVSIGNSAQYQYGNKYNGEGHANRFSNRTLVAHNNPISIFQNDTNTQLIDISLR